MYIALRQNTSLSLSLAQGRHLGKRSVSLAVGTASGLQDVGQLDVVPGRDGVSLTFLHCVKKDTSHDGSSARAVLTG